MAELFGFEIKRKTTDQDLGSFVPKQEDDGAVVVAEGGAGAPAFQIAAGCCLGEGAAFVAVEHVGAVVGDVEVRVSIIIVVGDRAAHAPADDPRAGICLLKRTKMEKY